MEPRDLSRRIAVGWLVAAAVAVGALAGGAGDWALAYAACAAWGLANLWVLSWLVRSLLRPEPSPFGVLWFPVKFVVLFGGAVAIVALDLLRPSAFLLGFHTALGVVIVDAVMRLVQTQRAAATSASQTKTEAIEASE